MHCSVEVVGAPLGIQADGDGPAGDDAELIAFRVGHHQKTPSAYSSRRRPPSASTAAVRQPDRRVRCRSAGDSSPLDGAHRPAESRCPPLLPPQPDVRARTVHDRSAEQFGPECGEPLGVGGVDDGGVDLQGHFCHASIFYPRAVARHGRRMPKAGHWSCRAAPEGRKSGGQMPRYLAQQVGEYGRLSGPVVRFPRRRFRTGGTWDRAAPAGSVAAPALPTGCPGPLRVNGTDPTGAAGPRGPAGALSVTQLPPTGGADGAYILSAILIVVPVA